jgi:hypothetical protein
MPDPTLLASLPIVLDGHSELAEGDPAFATRK